MHELFFLAFTCQSDEKRSCICTLFALLVYILILIGPIISAVTLAVCAFFFIYFWIGVTVYIVNKCRLNGFAYTANMVHYSNDPPFSFDLTNEFFELSVESVRGYYYSNNKADFYLSLVNAGRMKFMAYKDSFLSNNFE
jgi:hypothetical protein